MKNENLSKKFLTTITCPECGGRMIVEATRGNREDTFQASCFFCNECGRDTITFDDPDFEWKNDGIVLSPLQAASMHIGAGNVRKVLDTTMISQKRWRENPFPQWWYLCSFHLGYKA